MMEKKYKICFLILNYITYDETIKCVQSIIDMIDSANYEIVIVDNSSPDNSGNKILKKYENNRQIHVILNEENVGFLAGNNVGYVYAKNKLKCDFIVMLNSDTYLIQNDFFKQIIIEYNKSKFAILGPQIHNLNGKYQMHNGDLITISKLKKDLIKFRILKIINKLNFYYGPKEKNDVKNYDIRRENVVLHGCCLVFSPIFLYNFGELPVKSRFYYEEEILYIYSKMKNLKTVYCPSVKIFHLQKASTTRHTKSNKNRYDFIFTNLIKSGKVLLNELKKMEKKTNDK